MVITNAFIAVQRWQQSLPADEGVSSNPSWNNAERNETSTLLPRESVSGSPTRIKPQLLRLLRVRRLQIALVVSVVMMTLLAALEAVDPPCHIRDPPPNHNPGSKLSID